MEYRLGNSRKIKSRGNTYELICPNCNKLVQFGIFSNYERRLIAELPLVDCKTVYFLVCPECSSIYTVDEEIGDEAKKGCKENIDESKLKPLKEFKPLI